MCGRVSINKAENKFLEEKNYIPFTQLISWFHSIIKRFFKKLEKVSNLNLYWKPSYIYVLRPAKDYLIFLNFTMTSCLLWITRPSIWGGVDSDCLHASPCAGCRGGQDWLVEPPGTQLRAKVQRSQHQTTSSQNDATHVSLDGYTKCCGSRKRGDWQCQESREGYVEEETLTLKDE